jgi:hypothetical protein
MNPTRYHLLAAAATFCLSQTSFINGANVDSGDVSWLTRFGVGILSPDGAAALERIDRVNRVKKEPQEVYLAGLSDDFGVTLNTIYREADNIEIIESDDEEEEDYGTEPNREAGTVFFTSFTAGGGRTAPEPSNLCDFVFEGAAYHCNLPRIQQLIAARKKYLMTDEGLSKTFRYALMNSRNGPSKEDAYEIIRILLKEGFYLPEKFHETNYLRSDLVLDLLVHSALHDSRLLSMFLEYDRDFFRNLSRKYNIFQNVICEAVSFEAANFLLDNGADPGVLYGGKNALDLVLGLESAYYWYRNSDASMEQGRALADRLRNEFGLIESNN